MPRGLLFRICVRFLVAMTLTSVVVNLLLSRVSLTDVSLRRNFFEFSLSQRLTDTKYVLPSDRPEKRDVSSPPGGEHIVSRSSKPRKEPVETPRSTLTRLQSHNQKQYPQKTSFEMQPQPTNTSFDPLPRCRGFTLPGVSVMMQNATIFYEKFRERSDFHQTRWGNVISPYWAARTVAEIGGYEYHQGVDLAPGTWMEYLPKHVVPARVPRPEAYRRACTACEGKKWFLFHLCEYGWSDVRQTIVSDTRRALQAYSATRPKNETDQVTFWSDSTNDWLIYERCCILCHPVQGIGNIRAYDIIPSAGPVTVYTLSPPNIDKGEGHSLCSVLQSRRNAYLQSRNPQLTIVPLVPGALWVDFARIVYAPNLLVPSSGTSWGLWSMAANNGTVYAVTPIRNMTAEAVAHASTGNFHIMTSVPIAHEPEDLNLTAKDLKTTLGREKVLEWFMDGIELSP